ncbi:LamG domain-containing protein, partial [Pedobacter sp.]
MSFWAKSSGYSGLNYDPVFTYGTGTNSNAFSGSFSLDRVSINAHNDHTTFILGFGYQNIVQTWYHFSVSYDGTTTKIYRNGVLLGSLAKNWNTLNNNDIFKLGIGTGGEKWFNGAIDDLKIFDRAITDTEAEQLYKGDIDVCSDLISYFNFNSNATDHTQTISFSTTDPTYPITTTIGRNGGGDYALQTFQAATQPRTISLPELPIANNPRTIVFWMKTSTPFTTSQNYFTYGNAANAQTFGLYNNSSGALVFQGFGAGNDVTTTATIGQNVWVQVAIVHNSNMVKIYTNGVLRHSFVPTTMLNTGNSTFKIGAFNGAVDDLAIYKRPLSFGEIESLYTNASTNCGAKPIISAVSTSGSTVGGATINYSLRALNFATTSIVKYGIAEGNLSNQVNGFSASGNSVTSGNAVINGLPENITYYYQIEATSSEGTAISKGTFKSGGAIAEYRFDNTYNNVNGNTPFTNANTSFVADRLANANAALSRTSTANTASITNLPLGASPRTISLWVNSTDATNNSSLRSIFSYGSYSGGAPGIFNMLFYNNGGLALEGNGVAVVNNHSVTHNQWFHLVVVYDGSTISIYINGVIKHAVAKVLNTGNSSFSIGNFTGLVDDLLIYNIAFSDTQVTNMYNAYAALPVSLKSFTVKAQNNSTLLNWETASETNNSHFIVKRSVDGVNFSSISTLTAKSANGAKYQFVDRTPANGTNYYQLLQVDLDGKTTDLGTKTVSFSIKDAVNVFPNPTDNLA